MQNIFKQHRKTFIQASILGFIACLFGFTAGWLGFFSALLGGGCWIMPSVYFKRRMNKIIMSFDIQKMLRSFITNQVFKLASSFGLIIIILLLFPINKKAFLIGYAVMIFAFLPSLVQKAKTAKTVNKFKTFEAKNDGFEQV